VVTVDGQKYVSRAIGYYLLKGLNEIPVITKNDLFSYYLTPTLFNTIKESLNGMSYAD
jgi:hypothetical protein